MQSEIEITVGDVNDVEARVFARYVDQTGGGDEATYLHMPNRAACHGCT